MQVEDPIALVLPLGQAEHAAPAPAPYVLAAHAVSMQHPAGVSCNAIER